MTESPQIYRILRTIFNAEDGLSEDVAIGLYKRSVKNDGIVNDLKEELRSSFDDPNFSWKYALLNSQFEVYDADSEEDARAYARKILWDPIFAHD